MRFISWNVNGIRANIKKGAFQWLIDQNADFFCLQETKAHPDQLDAETLSPAGYTSYFDHSKGRKGYSGVAIYTKHKPLSVEYGMGTFDLDQEGRFIALHYKEFVLINIYFPNGGGGPERLAYKLRFYDAFLIYINNIRAKGLSVIFCGDVNTAHNEIDLARPKENVDNTGFLPIERAWMDQVVAAKYIDVFRTLNPEMKDVYTYWDMKTFARERNVGWRIDYFFVSDDLKKKITGFTTHAEVLGSDHCPIELDIKL